MLKNFNETLSPDGNGHAIRALLSQITNALDDSEPFRGIGRQYSGGGSPIQSIENIISHFCSSLDNFSGNLDVVAKEIRRFSDTMERLLALKHPIVFMEKESRQGGASSRRRRQKDRDRSATNVANGVHLDGDAERPVLRAP